MCRRLTGWLILALLVAICAWSQSAHAATNGLSIGPFLQEVTLTPAQADSSFIITLTNTTVADLPLRLSVVDFGAANENGAVTFLPTTDNLQRKYGLASWMSLEKDSLVLAHGTSQRVKVTIENKASLSPGGHYGAVIFQVDNKLGSNDIQPQVDFTKAVSTLVLVKKTGGERQSLTLSSTTWTGPPFNSPTDVYMRFLNNGNVHMAPTGDVTVSDMFGGTVSKALINPEQTVILPESFRVYPTNVSNSQTLWLPQWVTITTRYRNSDIDHYIINRSTVFVITPYAIGLVVLLLILAILAFHYRKWIMKHVHKLKHHTHHAAKKAVHKAKSKIKRKPHKS